MAYATEAEAIALYGSEYVTLCFDRDRDGVIDVGLPELMFDIATAEIDSYLIGRAPLPLAETPRDLMMRCVDIAIYRACPSAAELTEEKTTRFKAAIRWLQSVAKGEIKLTQLDGTSAGTHKTNRATLTTAYDAEQLLAPTDRWFTREGRRNNGI